MPVQELIRIRESNDTERSVKLLLAVNCAPLLKGSKAANIMTASLKEFNIIKRLVRGTGISYYLLKARDDKFIIYLYRKEALLRYLNRHDVKAFLKEYEYDTDSLSGMLVRLSIRCKAFCAGEEFPHEIGAFLEYPVEDIRGFMINKGEKFLATGYWKVYHNEKVKLKLFEQFDNERELSVNEVLQGKSIREICCI